MRHIPSIVLALAVALGTAAAQAPADTLSVSGLLRDAGGAPVAGPVELTFRLYDVAVGGAPLWSEQHPAVPVDATGRYHVQLGSTTPLLTALFATPDRWLAVEVASDGEMTPRAHLGRYPYSHDAILLDGLPATTFATRASLSDLDPGTTPVHWLDLIGVPAGFTDGVDDVDDADSDPTNELQTWSTLPGVPAGFSDGVDDVDDADSDPTNELQTWSTLPGVPAGFSDGTDDVDDADPDPANERNTMLALNGTTLELTDSGGTLTVDLSTLTGGGGGSGGGPSLAYPDPVSAVTPVTRRTLLTSPYTVPPGQTLYITSLYSQSSGYYLRVNNINAVHGATSQGQSSGNQTLGLPLVCGEGDVVSATDNSMAFNGFLTSPGVAPVHVRNLLSTPYTVPGGQVLVVLHVYSYDSAYQLQVGGVTVARGATNQGQSSGNQVIDQPIVAGPGESLTSNDNSLAIHGYLFGGTLGGGGGAANPDDLSFPDGLSGMTAVTIGRLQSTPYTPPPGRNLYITSYYSTASGADLRVDGKNLFTGNSNYGSGTNWNQHLEQPLVVGPAQSLTSTSDNPVVNGFLVDATTTPLTIGRLQSTPYVAPPGQIFVVLGYYSTASGADLRIDGLNVFTGNSMYGSGTSWTQRLGRPILVGAGQTLSSTSDNPVVNGYLRTP
jgi:hypothetical protein